MVKDGPRMRVVLPEMEDARVKEASGIIEKEGLAEIITLDKNFLQEGWVEEFSEGFYNLRKHKGVTQQEARRIILDPLFYGAMMVKKGRADGFVAGASHTTRDVVRAAIWCLGVRRDIGIASSAFIMAVPDCPFGEEGAFIFADCGVVPEPSPIQLTKIAKSAAELASVLLTIEPRVALLSFSSKGSGSGEHADRVKEAVRILNVEEPDLLVDGELQADSAIVPEVAIIKAPESPLKGRANVLIFPNLDAGNIGYKLVQRLAKARAIGPILLGLNAPCSDLSRGCDVEDVVDCVAVTALRSQRQARSGLKEPDEDISNQLR
jgi:phosphate acetyltransferase